MCPPFPTIIEAYLLDLPKYYFSGSKIQNDIMIGSEMQITWLSFRGGGESYLMRVPELKISMQWSFVVERETSVTAVLP